MKIIFATGSICSYNLPKICMIERNNGTTVAQIQNWMITHDIYSMIKADLDPTEFDFFKNVIYKNMDVTYQDITSLNILETKDILILLNSNKDEDEDIYINIDTWKVKGE